MIKKPVVIQNNMEMEDRPIAPLVQEASQYSSQVYLVMDDKKINAKSIMNLMASGIKQGSEIEIRCEGQDEQVALEKAVALIESGLGE